MRKKNLSVKVAALAMSGTLAMAPMTVRAEEVAVAPTAPAAPAATITETTETAAASTETTETAATSTETTEPTAASTPAAAPAATPVAGSSGTAGGTTASAPVTVVEPAVDPSTTVPNNVNTIIPEENNNFQGTKIDVGSYVNKEIKAEDAKGTKGDTNFNPGFLGSIGTNLGSVKNKDLVITGDLSIKESSVPDTEYDSTSSNPHDAESEKTYTLKADLDVSAVHNAITASSGIAARNDTYVTNLTTGLRATFILEGDLNGRFFVPTTLAEKQEHYQLSSGDSNPMIFRINYTDSHFEEKKVTIAMDLDLTQVKPFANKYSGGKTGKETLYVIDPVTGSKTNVENFNHPEAEYGVYHNTSVFGNLKQLVTSSAKKNSVGDEGCKTEFRYIK